jgi:prepilin-type processing-associated H-X9-DG protein
MPSGTPCGFYTHRTARRHRDHRGFGGLFLPALARAQSKARAIGCMNQMRQIALAVRFYADDNGDEFPRSQHSAFAYSQLTWGRALAPWLGPQGSTWTNLLLSFYHCPGDKRPAAWSYGQNVYFELGDDDDYFGKPKTWRLLTRISKPCATILFAENATGADHIMAHFWTTPADAADVDAVRHCGRANYIFVDGHAECRDLRDTFDPARSRDAWNPQTAQ